MKISDTKSVNRSTLPSTPEEYVKAQRNCGLKVGDIVLIAFIVQSHEYGWGNSWVSTMDKTVGTYSRVIRALPDNRGIFLSNDYGYPFFCLIPFNET